MAGVGCNPTGARIGFDSQHLCNSRNQARPASVMVNAQADAQMSRVAKSAETDISGTTGLPVIQRPDRLQHH
jgi:hypothetical protein